MTTLGTVTSGKLALAGFLLLSNPALAAEIDSVTLRNVELRDSVERIDSLINGYVREGVERANERSADCDKAELYKQIKRSIAFPLIGQSVAEQLNAAADFDSRRVLFEDSIYRDLGLFDAISVHLKDLSGVIRLDDHLVGVDKIGHFLAQGWRYFEIAYLDEEGIEAAMRWGELTESTFYGFYTTGIYSYADLTVNFEGMRFWLRILGSEKDPLKKGYFFNRPYVKCSRRFWIGERRWRMKREVRLDRYLGGAWDEGMNCSRYRGQEIEELISHRIEERELIDGEDYTCPIEPAACVRARERYGVYADGLLHPLCLAQQPAPRPWWKLW